MSMLDSLRSKLGIDPEADSYVDDTEENGFPRRAGGLQLRRSIPSSRRSNSTAIRS